MKVFLDTNILIDLAENRVEASQAATFFNSSVIARLIKSLIVLPVAAT